jgi:AAA domain
MPPIPSVRVVILCGLPGVGKLTIANGLADLRGFRVFHNHLVFDAVEALFDFGSPSFIELRERLWLELLARAVRERVGDIAFTIARDQSLRADFLIALVSALSEVGANVHCIELACSTDELAQRIVSTDRARFGKITSFERFCQLSSSGAFPRFTMPAEAISIDTTGLAAGAVIAAVDAIVNRAQSAG